MGGKKVVFWLSVEGGQGGKLPLEFEVETFLNVNMDRSGRLVMEKTLISGK